MAIITVAALKGGVGKSTLAVNLACAMPGPVVLVDADSQGTATAWAVGGELPVEVLAMPLEDERQTPAWVRDVLSLASSTTVVIDGPPHLRAATVAAIALADLVLLPVSASGADLVATTRALELVRAARADGAEMKCLLVPSRVDFRTLAGRELAGALKKLGEPVGPPVRQLAAHVDAFSAGQWIGRYAAGSPAHDDLVALAAVIKQKVKA